jgi:hypothetical protein
VATGWAHSPCTSNRAVVCRLPARDGSDTPPTLPNARLPGARGAQLAAETPVLFDQIVDNLPFPAGQPAGHDHQQQLEGGGVDHGPQLISRPRLEAVG